MNGFTSKTACATFCVTQAAFDQAFDERVYCAKKLSSFQCGVWAVLATARMIS